jgi:hypothetical protein
LIGSRREFLAACASLLLQSQRKKRVSKPIFALAPIRFREVAQQAGLDFVLQNNPTPRKHLIETMPGGVAAFDYDGDGLTDIFFTNGASIPSLEKDSPKFFNRLYRNTGGMKFKDVTLEAGVFGAGYSMGAAAADYNNDGYTDLFVAGVYRNILYRNLGNGKFEDVTEAADKWSVAAGWSWSTMRTGRRILTANQLKADMVMLTGDYVSWDPSAQAEVVNALADLRAPFGVFGCLGNHETITRTEASITELFASQTSACCGRSMHPFSRRARSSI